MSNFIQAHNLNRMFQRPDLERLPAHSIEYATEIIHGLHVALRDQVEPPYHRPEHPVTGWGLTATPLSERGEFLGIPTFSMLGSRAIYLAAGSSIMYRVLSVPHPRIVMDEKPIQIRQTNVPRLLQEDPSLYPALLSSVEENVREFQLDYEYQQA